MNKILDSIKNFCKKISDVVSNKIDGRKIKKFFRKNWRYFAAILLLIVLILVLYNCTGPEAGKAEEDTETEAEPTAANFVLDDKFEQDAHEDVNALIENYFATYASGNVGELEAIAYPISDNEKSYIGVCSQYMESYQNISCYTKSGLTEGSYLVSAYYELKFYGVETPAPGVEFFYVETDENGNLYINNLYSSYNRERMEDEMDSNIYAIYVLYGQQEDVQLLREDVQKKYQEALSADVDLVTMLSTTFPEAIESWKNTILAIEQSEENETETPQENTEAVTEGAEQEGENGTTPEEEPQEEVTKTVRITAGSVNVRSEASKDSSSLGKVSEGDTYTKLGESGEWTQIDYNGTPAYVKTEYVQEVTNE